VQAAIAAEHALAPSAAAVNWAAIATLYERLMAMTPSPVVELNRAVAVAMAEGPERGLELVDGLEGAAELRRYHLFHATRADLLRRLGRDREAAAAYRRARDLAANPVERSFLERRLREVG
jgi:RNA polymerase sigma-70 factor (ECF subfamily)